MSLTESQAFDLTQTSIEKTKTMKTIRAVILTTAIAAHLRPRGEAVEEPVIKAPPPKPVVAATESVKLKDLIVDADTQNRVSIDQETIEKYKEIVKEAKKGAQPIPFPALSAVRGKDGKLYLWDGFHRNDALRAAHETEFDVDLYDVPEGWEAQEYAQLLALSANATHGKQRTNADIKRAVKNALSNPDISKWSNPIIADWVGVSEATIRNYIKAVGAPTVKLAKRGNKTVTIDTARIGKKGGKKPKPKKADKKGKGKDKEAAEKKPGKGQGQVVDDALRAAIVKISGGITPDSLATKVRKGLETDGLGLNRAEIIHWASHSKDRIGEIVHLVLDLEMKPTRAYNFLDRELAGNTNLDSLAILLLTHQKRTETVGNLELKFPGDGTLTIKLLKTDKKQ